MTRFGTFASLWSAALLCTAPLTSLASNRAPATIHVLCNTDGEPPICEALVKAIATAHPQRTVVLQDRKAPVPDQLNIAYVAEKSTNDVVSGHLIWVDPKGQRGTGPTITLSVMDARMNRYMLGAFASQMLRHSGLPI
ncbi:MAG: hypothetical protein AB8B51_04150 [Sedimentitalea sp.]